MVQKLDFTILVMTRHFQKILNLAQLITLFLEAKAGLTKKKIFVGLAGHAIVREEIDHEIENQKLE